MKSCEGSQGSVVGPVVAVIAVALGLIGPVPCRAATLEEVNGFGDSPANTRMFIYVPDKLHSPPPVLVAVHYCHGDANAFFMGSGYRALADQHGFIVIYPQAAADDGCFDVHSDATLRHDGGGDSLGIASMVRYTLAKYAADPERVYVTGVSSGAMMTNVLLGAYPDLFRAGSAFAGVPYGCFAGPDAWNSACADGQITKTGQQWGDLVRSGFPEYTGPRPRAQLWHGDRDETLSFHNFGEEVKQWTNVLGVNEQPTTTERGVPEATWTRTRYADSAGVVQVEAIIETSQPHNLKVLAEQAVQFFELDAEPGPAPRARGAAGAPASSPGATSAGAAGNGTSAAGAAAQVEGDVRRDAARAVAAGAGGMGAATGSTAAGGAASSSAAVSGSAGTQPNQNAKSRSMAQTGTAEAGDVDSRMPAAAAQSSDVMQASPSRTAAPSGTDASDTRRDQSGGCSATGASPGGAAWLVALWLMQARRPRRLRLRGGHNLRERRAAHNRGLVS
jgi:poly(hydroxyalkanoate) depolymerase family esterase